MPYKDPKDPRKLASVYAWAAAHPEKVKAAKQKYADKNKEAVRERIAKWRAANKEKMQAARDNWLANNKHRHAANVRRRQAGKTKRTPKWLTKDDYWMMAEAYHLAQLRTKLFGFDWHVDHILPLHGKTVSGLHVPTNLQVIPGSDNCRKYNNV